MSIRISQRTGGIIFCSLAYAAVTAVWFLSYAASPGTFVSAYPKPSMAYYFTMIAALFAFVLCYVRKESRPLAAVFIIFAADSATSLLLSVVGPVVFPKLASDLPSKLTFDALHFSVEIALYCLALLPIFPVLSVRSSSPRDGVARVLAFAPFERTSRVRRSIITVLFVLTMLILIMLIVRTWMKPVTGEPLMRIWPFLIILSILVAVLNELPFRWIMPRAIRSVSGSWLIGILLPALAWALYHAFFGEGMPRGAAGFIISFAGAIWFQILVDEFRTLRFAVIMHALIELYAFGQLYAR
ncbi:MAG: CPBP family intramembrane glutamic endopeptidase [Spirochaetota bacterium]